MPKILTFADYKPEAHQWITIATGQYYPDILKDACELYKPVLIKFGEILRVASSSQDLFMKIAEVTDPWLRVQLTRLFRKYVSPTTPVEMLKRKRDAEIICHNYGDNFREIKDVKKAFSARPIPDEPLCAILWEYKDRGQKGYDLTEKFFNLFRSQFKDLPIKGPERAGKDILLGTIFPEYPNPNRPVDFIVYDTDATTVLAVGLARYDSDRGGAQEDDRTGGYNNCAHEILTYAATHKLHTKVVFINDGPGLLLGSMWNDYSKLEQSFKGQIMVATLRMIPDRLTYTWLRS